MTPTRPQLAGTFGMVTSTHWLASAAGMAELEQGGNAFDAAVAVGVRAARGRAAPQRPRRRGAAPLRPGRRPRADRPVWTGSGAGRGHRRALPRPRLRAGARGRPARRRGAGRGRGLADPAARPRHAGGWPTCCAYAIEYAERGHPLQRGRGARPSAGCGELFAEDWTTSAELYLPGGAPPAAGAAVPQPGAGRAPTGAWSRRRRPRGRTARPASTRPPAAWRQGFVAEAIDAFARRPFRHPGRRAAHPGVITGADLAAFTAALRADRGSHPFRDVVVHKTRAWGQGPVLLQQLALLDGFADAGHRSVHCGWCAPSWSRWASSPSPTGRPGTATRAPPPLDAAALARVHRGPAAS